MCRLVKARVRTWLTGTAGFRVERIWLGADQVALCAKCGDAPKVNTPGGTE